MAEPRQSAFWVRRWKPIAGVLVAVIVANVAIHLGVIRKTVEVSGDREAILATERGRLTQLEKDIVRLERTVSKVACTRSDEERVFNELLSGKSQRMTAVLRELTQLAREMRVDPENLSFSRSAGEQSGLVRFTAAFGFEAPYRVLHEFIEKIENSENFLFIERVSLSGARSSSDDLRLQIRVATWFQGPDLERLDAVLPGSSKGGRP